VSRPAYIVVGDALTNLRIARPVAYPGLDLEEVQPVDEARLDDAGYADAAIGDRALANGVAEFKGKFFREKDKDGNWIDYTAAVSALFNWYRMRRPRKRWRRTTRKWRTTGSFWMTPSPSPTS